MHSGAGVKFLSATGETLDLIPRSSTFVLFMRIKDDEGSRPFYFTCDCGWSGNLHIVGWKLRG